MSDAASRKSPRVLDLMSHESFIKDAASSRLLTELFFNEHHYRIYEAYALLVILNESHARLIKP